MARQLVSGEPGTLVPELHGTYLQSWPTTHTSANWKFWWISNRYNLSWKQRNLVFLDICGGHIIKCTISHAFSNIKNTSRYLSLTAFTTFPDPLNPGVWSQKRQCNLTFSWKRTQRKFKKVFLLITTFSDFLEYNKQYVLSKTTPKFIFHVMNQWMIIIIMTHWEHWYIIRQFLNVYSSRQWETSIIFSGLKMRKQFHALPHLISVITLWAWFSYDSYNTCRNWSSERPRNLPKLTQQIGGREGPQTQIFLTQKSGFWVIVLQFSKYFIL